MHDGLDVVALLYANVQIAGAVAGDEELLECLKRGFVREAPCLDVGLVVRKEILVDASKSAVVLALAPHRVVEDAKRLQRFVESTRTVQRNVRKRRGDVGKPSFLGFDAIAFYEVQNGLDGKTRVLEEIDSLGIALRAAFRETRIDFAEPCAKSVADRRREVCRQVEDDALLAKCRSRCAARGHLLIRMQVGNLLHRPKERETLPVHKRGRLGIQHLLESDARARHVARAFGDEPLK